MRFFVMATMAAALALGGCDALSGGSAADTEQAAAKGGDAGAATEGGDAAASNLDPVLANPAVGDVWAADLSHFSAADFNGDSGTQAEAFGQVKVVEVTPEQVIVITEDAAWPDAAGARRELEDRSAVIRWDESERIPVNRADFARLVEEEKILATRR